MCRVQVETDFLRDVPDQEGLEERLALLNRFASLNAFVWDAGRRRLTLRCGVYVHGENVAWLQRLLAGAAAIQVADAHIKIGLAEVLGGEADASAHPRQGHREAMDDMLHIIERLFAPQGQRDSPFTHAEFVALAEMTPRPWLLATTGDVRGPGITAEFPFYDNVPALLAERAETALFTATATERHPQLGSGALFRLSLPDPRGEWTRTAGELARRANDLNRAETFEWTACHFLGAWCAHSSPFLGISFVTFLPAALYIPRLLENLVLSTALRARWVKTHFDGHT